MQAIPMTGISTKSGRYGWLIAVALISLLVGSGAAQTEQKQPKHLETIVVIRHGEKPHGGLGQLTCEGLNRALALPKVLTEKYGIPNYIFAPNPAIPMREGGEKYSYVRPLATIEPTAIQLGLPVNTSIGFNDVQALQTELTSPKYSDAVIFVAWEHVMAQRFAERIMSALGSDPKQVPHWSGSDYDSIYVLRLTRTGEKSAVSFEYDHEGLNDKLPSTCPSLPL